VYRPCIASFEVDLQEPETNTMGSKLKDDFEPYWDDEKDWLCTVEFLPPRDDPEARSFSAEIIGYLFGYAHLTNTRSLALLGDPDANAYELLFSFSSPEEKEQFLDLEPVTKPSANQAGPFFLGREASDHLIPNQIFRRIEVD
jgi:hypothetical protein